MKKFVINLKRRPDRLEQFKQRCPYTDIEVIYGFDGKFASQEKEKNLFKSFKKISSGARGCWISHLRIWKQMVEQNLKTVMIFEDDAMFHENFKSIMEKVIPPTDGIVYIGGRFNPNFVIPPPFATKVNDFLCKTNVENWTPMFHERTTHAYIISLDVAKLFIQTFYANQDQEAVDYFMVCTLKQNGIPMYHTVPLLCHSPMVSDSDIR